MSMKSIELIVYDSFEEYLDRYKVNRVELAERLGMRNQNLKTHESGNVIIEDERGNITTILRKKSDRLKWRNR